MFQHHVPWLLTALMIGLAAPVLADEAATNTNTKENAPDAPDAPDAIERQASQNQVLAHKMMGHINLAQLALDLNLPSEAAKQVARAQSIEETLMSQMLELTLNSSFKYGKVTYGDESVVTDHYIPIVDDVFLVSDYKAIFKRAETVDLDELSAGVMHLGVSVDLRDVKSALDRAATTIESKDYAAARMSLKDVFKNAIIDEEEVDDPKLLITETLALAKSFIDEQQYDSARLALKHVQDRLKSTKTNEYSGVDKVSLDKFSTELDEMRADLREKDPTLSERVSSRLTDWGKTVAGWFS